jgi:hypothetical protein
VLILTGAVLAAVPSSAPAQGTSRMSGSSFGSGGGPGGSGSSFGSGGGPGSSFGGSGSSSTSMSSTSSLASGFNLGVGSTTGPTNRGGTSGVGSTTFLGQYYANPIAMGIGSATGSTTTTSTAFGSPIYNLQTSTSTTQTYNIVGRGTTNQAVITAPNMINGLGNGWQGRRPVSYRVTTDLPRPNRPASEMRAELQGVLTRSSRLSNPSDIRVVMDGSTVVLQGRVRNQAERRLAENLVALERGVTTIRNELQAPAEPSE